MEALTIDEIISAKKRFLNIDKDLNLIHSVNEIIHNVLFFSHLCEKKYAYELLDKLNLCDQDYGKIRHVMSEFYKKEGM